MTTRELQWKAVAQTGAWIAASVLAVVVEPPTHSISGANSILAWAGLARYLIVVSIGLTLVIAATFTGRGYLRHWVITSIAGLISGTILLGVYGSLMLPWTCETAEHVRVVIGTELSTKAATNKADDCTALLSDFQTNSLLVWKPAGVFQHEIILGWLFVLAVSMSGIGVIALLEAYKIVHSPQIARKA